MQLIALTLNLSPTPFVIYWTLNVVWKKRVRLQGKGTNNPQYSADQYMTMYADDANEIVESSVTGVDNIVEQFAGCMQTIPDGIFLVHEWKMFFSG